jgi:hypothetical protein
LLFRGPSKEVKATDRRRRLPLEKRVGRLDAGLLHTLFSLPADKPVTRLAKNFIEPVRPHRCRLFKKAWPDSRAAVKLAACHRPALTNWHSNKELGIRTRIGLPASGGL